MAQGSPQTIVQSIEHAVEAAMQAVQVAQPQHMVHHMPQQAQLPTVSFDCFLSGLE